LTFAATRGWARIGDSESGKDHVKFWFFADVELELNSKLTSRQPSKLENNPSLAVITAGGAH